MDDTAKTRQKLGLQRFQCQKRFLICFCSIWPSIHLTLNRLTLLYTLRTTNSWTTSCSDPTVIFGHPGTFFGSGSVIVKGESLASTELHRVRYGHARPGNKDWIPTYWDYGTISVTLNSAS